MNGLFRAAFLGALLFLSAAASATLVPERRSIAASAPDLDAILPDHFGAWKRAPLGALVLPPETRLGPGEAVAYRAYRDDLGRTVTLVVAYGPPLGDSVRLHRPEKCYRAQGFSILNRSEEKITLDGREANIVHLDTESPDKRESVTYLLREGSHFTTSAAENPIERLFRNGAAPLDGALIRISTNNPVSSEMALQETFLQEFAAALGPDGKHILLGRAEAKS